MSENLLVIQLDSFPGYFRNMYTNLIIIEYDTSVLTISGHFSLS